MRKLDLFHPYLLTIGSGAPHLVFFVNFAQVLSLYFLSLQAHVRSSLDPFRSFSESGKAAGVFETRQVRGEVSVVSRWVRFKTPIQPIHSIGNRNNLHIWGVRKLTYLLDQWLNFKRFLDYIFNRENKVQFFISGSIG